MIYKGAAAQLLKMVKGCGSCSAQQLPESKGGGAELGGVQAGAVCLGELHQADPLRTEAMDATVGKIIIDGNAAAALGCIFADAQSPWYPITPSSSLVKFYRLRKTARQRERQRPTVAQRDELAAIGAVLGAAGRVRAR